MGRFLGLLFLIDLSGFFHFGSAASKNAGDVHPFKAFFICLCRGFLRLLKSRSRFRRFMFLCFGFLWFSLLNDWRGLSEMKNSGRFHTCFSSVFLLKLRGNWTGGFSVLKKSTLLVLWSVFCCAFCGLRFRLRMLWLRFGFSPRLGLIFS